MLVKVFNDKAPACSIKISENIMEGVVNIPTGAWLTHQKMIHQAVYIILTC